MPGCDGRWLRHAVPPTQVMGIGRHPSPKQWSSPVLDVLSFGIVFVGLLAVLVAVGSLVLGLLIVLNGLVGTFRPVR